MYTKSYFETDDMASQHDILNTIAGLLDSGKLKSTVSKTLSPINAKNLREAHRLVETNHMLGKVVITKYSYPHMTNAAHMHGRSQVQ